MLDEELKRRKYRYISRGYADQQTKVGIAVSLESHHNNVYKLFDILFSRKLEERDPLLYESIRLATLQHDKYKPATLSLIKDEETNLLTTTFLGHPYFLGFSDFEEVEERDWKKVALATGIGRLHHILNVRDLDVFVQSLAYVKNYLFTHNVDMSTSLIRQRLLVGVLLLHICDNISAFVESYLAQKVLREITKRNYEGRLQEIIGRDTSSGERIYPHLPMAILVEEKQPERFQIYFHSLEQFYDPKSKNIALEYEVYTGKYDIEEKQRKEVAKKVKGFEPYEIHKFKVSLHIAHKSEVILTNLRR